MIHCHICFQVTDEDFLCDTCDEYYCDECSYTFSLHYQHQGARCHWCSDQSRRRPITKEEIRNNKLKLILNENPIN
jgi:hypothetical protein